MWDSTPVSCWRLLCLCLRFSIKSSSKLFIQVKSLVFRLVLSVMSQAARSSSQKPWNTRVRCYVKSCKSYSHGQRRLGFHLFPKANVSFVRTKNEKGEIETMDRLEAWKIALNITYVPSSARICSNHFRDEDYFFCQRVEAKKRYLKKTAVPTLFVPNDSFKNIQMHVDNSLFDNNPKKGKNEFMQNTDVKEEIEFVNVKTEPFPDDLSFESLDAMSVDEDSKFPRIEKTSSTISTQTDDVINTNIVKTFQDAAVQVHSNYSLPKFSSFLSNDSDLNTMTGIQNWDALDALVECVKIESENRYEKPNCELKTKERVILTCIKVKHDLSYSFLMILFKSHNEKLSYSSCRLIFQEMINVLYKCYKKIPKEDPLAVTLKRFNFEKYRQFFVDEVFIGDEDI